MSTMMVIILAVGLAAVLGFACVFLFVLSRLRRVIKSQVEAIEKMVGGVHAGQKKDVSGESPQQPL